MDSDISVCVCVCVAPQLHSLPLHVNKSAVVVYGDHDEINPKLSRISLFSPYSQKPLGLHAYVCGHHHIYSVYVDVHACGPCLHKPSSLPKR